jgi:glycosyltransferase involved in cell wall biosynthesis
MNSPRISVIIDSFNQEKFIEQAVHSVLRQDLPPDEFEIIAVDDGSTDRTPEILKDFEPRIRLYRKQNGGQASALNVAIAETSAEFVAFLDGDDWWDESKLSVILEAFARYPNAAAIGHGFYEVYGDAPAQEMFLPDRTRVLDLSSREAARIASLGRTLLGTSRLALRRSVLDRIGPIPPELVFCADTPLLTLSLALGGAVVIDRPLCFYRRHDDNLFMQNSQEPAKVRRRAETLAFLLDYLTPRLDQLGVDREIIKELFAADEVELARLRVQLRGRRSWSSARAEIKDLRTSYRNPGAAYWLFKSFVAVVSLVLPPAKFERVRKWYTANRLSRVRGWFAAAEPVVSPSIFRRHPVPAEGDLNLKGRASAAPDRGRAVKPENL